MEVREVGVGFEVPAYLGAQVDRGHLGLIRMRERAAEVGARLDITSVPGERTRVLIDVPLTSS